MNLRDPRKYNKCKDDSRHVVKLEIPVRDYKGCPTRKGYRGESRGDNADSTDRGFPLRQHGQKSIPARSRFVGVSRPRNEGNRRLRSKAALKLQSLMTSTSKSGQERSGQHPRDANTKTEGYMFPSCTCCRGRWSKKENQANLQRYFELIL